jgi:tripartite-type tricarboxylate transporter receptor subunit TctC
MRIVTLLVAFAVAAASATGSFAQSTDQPLRVVLPYAAGGVGDVVLRLIGEQLRASLGRPVIVENKAGAAGRIGVQAVKNAAPDGNTLLFVPIAPMSVFPHVYDKLEYDAIKDFAPVSQVATFDLAVAVGPAAPVTTTRGLVDWIKANPAKASYGVPAAGSLPHFFAMLFAKTAGVEMRHVPYKGNSPALADLMGGHLPIYFTSTQDFVEYHKAGKLRVLATSGAQRSAVLTDVPTFREAGFPIEGDGWYGVFAPAGTPDATVARLGAAIAAAVKSAPISARMTALGLLPTGTTPAEFARIQRADLDLWGPVIRASGFKVRQ